MEEWQRNLQAMVDEIDACIRRGDSEAVSLRYLAARFHYSPY